VVRTLRVERNEADLLGELLAALTDLAIDLPLTKDTYELHTELINVLLVVVATRSHAQVGACECSTWF